MKYKSKCHTCDKKYEFEHKDIYATDIKDYCKVLGCCNKECYNDIPRAERNYLSIMHFLKMRKYERDVKS